jgi:methyl-accepting chemotaxis protein
MGDTDMKKPYRRKNYFIKKDLQGRFIFSFFIFVVVGSFFFTIIFSLLSADTLTIAYKNYDLRLGKTPVILLKETLGAHWIFIFTGGLLVVLASVFLTHRFAGPVYRFEKSLEEMMKGNFDVDIRLRAKDEAKELAQMLNDFNAGLSSQLKEIRDLSDKAGAHITNAKGAIGPEAARELDEAAAKNRRIGEILRNFKLKNDN